MVIVVLLDLGVLGYLPKSKRDLGLLATARFLRTLSLKFYFCKKFYQFAKLHYQTFFGPAAVAETFL